MRMVNSIAELRECMNDKVEDVFRGEVFEHVKETILAHIWSDVYNTYEPEEYVRRYENGGLGDPGEIFYTLDRNKDGCKMLVSTSATMNGFASRIETLGQRINDTGFPRNNPPRYIWEFPRPFMDQAYDEVLTSGKIERIFKGVFK